MKKLPVLFLVLVLAGFFFGLLHLFRMRFEAGDIYPEYSSLRADPLGTKAFYEGVANLLAADRNYRPFSKLGEGRDSTFFYLAAQATLGFEARSDLRLSLDDFKSLESFVADGGRLVISFFPSFQKDSTNRLAAKSAPSSQLPPIITKKKAPTLKPKREGEEDEFEDFGEVSIRDRWGLQYGHDELLKGDKQAYQAAVAVKIDRSETLPASLPCHTSLFFDKVTNSWHVIYARKPRRPVIIERKLGAGSIVLSADSYFFSNEALSKERFPGLLAWMVGPSRRVIFDETHLGLHESFGISALARKYRLHGLLLGLLLLAALFIWKNSTSFMPYQEDTPPAEGGLVTGKDSATGFVNLLRRNLPAREVLAICLAEWKKSCSREQPKAKLQKMQAIIDSENERPAGERDPVQTYREISKILSKSSEFRVPGSECRVPGSEF